MSLSVISFQVSAYINNVVVCRATNKQTNNPTASICQILTNGIQCGSYTATSKSHNLNAALDYIHECSTESIYIKMVHDEACGPTLIPSNAYENTPSHINTLRNWQNIQHKKATR